MTPPWRAAPAPGPTGGSPGTTGKAAAGTAASPGVAEAASPGVAKGTSPGVAKGTSPGVATAARPVLAGKGPGPAASPGGVRPPGSAAVASPAVPAATGAGETPAAVPRPPPQAPRTAALEARLLSLRRVLLTVIRLSTDADQTIRDLSRTLFAEDARVCRDDPYQDA